MILPLVPLSVQHTKIAGTCPLKQVNNQAITTLSMNWDYQYYSIYSRIGHTFSPKYSLKTRGVTYPLNILVIRMQNSTNAVIFVISCAEV